jgi:hypothetical protein
MMIREFTLKKVKINFWVIADFGRLVIGQRCNDNSEERVDLIFLDGGLFPYLFVPLPIGEKSLPESRISEVFGIRDKYVSVEGRIYLVEWKSFTFLLVYSNTNMENNHLVGGSVLKEGDLLPICADPSEIKPLPKTIAIYRIQNGKFMPF